MDCTARETGQVKAALARRWATRSDSPTCNLPWWPSGRVRGAGQVVKQRPRRAGFHGRLQRPVILEQLQKLCRVFGTRVALRPHSPYLPTIATTIRCVSIHSCNLHSGLLGSLRAVDASSTSLRDARPR